MRETSGTARHPAVAIGTVLRDSHSRLQPSVDGCVPHADNPSTGYGTPHACAGDGRGGVIAVAVRAVDSYTVLRVDWAYRPHVI